jgi:tetraacyldisaccharide 4'-kinase
MGGTLAEKGGHNILEPALFGKPVIAGPHLENFRDIEEHFEIHRALLRISHGDELPHAIRTASADPGLGARALEAAVQQRGAAARLADAVVNLCNTRYPADRLPQPAWMFLWFFAQIWRAGSAWDRMRKRSRARKLPVPVVSIGNITAGGTGKTPVTIELLRDFKAMSPGLLTRGHGRNTNDIVLLPKGDESLSVDLTGDEAQLYMRGAGVPIGIGADRYDAGMQLLEAVPVKVLFLDDGFQHLQLHRDFDLVLIDSLHPFGGGHLLPLGRLREPLKALSRANAFLITRENESIATMAIESVLRRWNPNAPVFRARTVPRYWTNHHGDRLGIEEIRGVRAVAFCGLGNPQAFWRTVDRLGVTPIASHHYGDHHRYNPLEFRRLVQHAKDVNASALLTTAKDAVNLCPDFASMIDPLKLWWLEIGIEIDRREDLLALIFPNLVQRFPVPRH